MGLVNYDEILGTLLVGIFFNTYLYGLVTYQFAAYYRANFNDRPVTKYTVLFLFVLDTFQSAILVYMAWNYTVTNFGNAAALTLAEWPYTFNPIGTALTAFMTQMYQGFRIWRLTESKLLYTIVIVLAITSSILGIMSGIEAWTIRVESEFPRMVPIGTSWLAAQVVADLFISVTFITIFCRSKTGFRRTDSLLQLLIRGAIQTSVFAGLFSIADLICFAIVPHLNFHGMFSIPIGRIYTNTLMDTLLTRESLRSMSDTLATGPIDWETPTDSVDGTTTTGQTSIILKIQNTSQVTCCHERLSKEGADNTDVSLAV